MPVVPLQFVVGKGGVGKSTLSAALALAAARQKRRVLAVELGSAGGLARAFSVSPAAPGVPAEARPGIWIAYVEGEAALAEYLELIIPIRRLLAAVFASRIYRYFVAAAPGLKELMTVGKVWYEHDRREVNGDRAWDVIVVDAGASGHSLQYLQMPSVAARTFRSGLVHREAVKIHEFLRSPTVTAIHVVATPEDMPLTEARQIVERLRGDLSLPLGGVFINRCRALAPKGVEDAVENLSRIELETSALPFPVDARTLKDGIYDSCQRALNWARIQEAGIARLERSVGSRVIRLPLLATEEFGFSEICALANVVEQRLAQDAR